MSQRRRGTGRVGESLLTVLALIAYYTYEKLIQFPLLASLIFGLIVSFIVVATLLILRAQRIRKANLLAKESLYRDYSPIEFEHLTAEIYRLLGYKADVTPPSGDKGLDVILSTAENKIGVQCKRYQDIIGPAFIREFAGALEGAFL
jgi:HJR/Mrr/RecB family endonuclease